MKNGTSHPHVIIKIDKKQIGKNYPKTMEWDCVRIIHKNNYANENNKNLDLPLKLQEYREIFVIESPSQRTPGPSQFDPHPQLHGSFRLLHLEQLLIPFTPS